MNDMHKNTQFERGTSNVARKEARMWCRTLPVLCDHADRYRILILLFKYYLIDEFEQIE